MAEINQNLVIFLKKLKENPEFINNFLAKQNIKKMYQYATTIQSGFTMQEFEKMIAALIYSSKKECGKKSVSEPKNNLHPVSDEKLVEVNGGSSLFPEKSVTKGELGVFDFISEIIAYKDLGSRLGKQLREPFDDLIRVIKLSPEEYEAEELAKSASVKNSNKF